MSISLISLRRGLPVMQRFEVSLMRRVGTLPKGAVRRPLSLRQVLFGSSLAMIAAATMTSADCAAGSGAGEGSGTGGGDVTPGSGRYVILHSAAKHVAANPPTSLITRFHRSDPTKALIAQVAPIVQKVIISFVSISQLSTDIRICTT
jgi:hypothetical protein